MQEGKALELPQPRAPERRGPGRPGAQRRLQRRGLDGRGGSVLHRRLAQRYQLRRPGVQCVLQSSAWTIRVITLCMSSVQLT